MSIFDSLPFEITCTIADFLTIWDLASWKAVSCLFYQAYLKQLRNRKQRFIERVTSISPKWTWTTVPVHGKIPLKHWSSSMIVLPELPERLLMFGGESDKFLFFNDVYILYLREMKWEKMNTKGPKPEPRGFPSVHNCKIGGAWHVLVFGGQSRTDLLKWTFYNNLFLLNIATWTWTKIQTPPDAPRARVGQRGCIMGNKFWVHGGTFVGSNNIYSYLGDLHYFDLETLEWNVMSSCSAPIPCQRQSATITALSDHRFAVVAGNNNVRNHISGNLNDVYIFDTETTKWEGIEFSSTLSLERRWCHATSAITEDVLLVVAGWGVHEVITFDEIWLGNLERKEWKKVKVVGDVPAQRLFFGFVKIFDFFIMGYGTAEDNLVLYFLRCE